MHDALTTRGLLERIVRDHPGSIPLAELLDAVSERAFGLFLLIAILPAFLPLPAGAGAVSGPLVVLAGIQLLAQAEHPWLPRWLQRRLVPISSINRFQTLIAKPLAWLERVSRPSWPAMIDHPLAKAFTGLLLVLLGILLALPVPLTNYPFGLILLVFAVALIERDGRTLALAWALGLAQLAFIWLFVDNAAEIAMNAFQSVVSWF